MVKDWRIMAFRPTAVVSMELAELGFVTSIQLDEVGMASTACFKKKVEASRLVYSIHQDFACQDPVNSTEGLWGELFGESFMRTTGDINLVAMWRYSNMCPQEFCNFTL